MTTQFSIFGFLFLLLPQVAYLQLTDNFSNGDLWNNPAWQGDVGNFVVNADLELQLNAPVAGQSSLYVPVEIADSALWEFIFRLDFDPSGSNNLRIVLQTDDTTFSAGNGYALYLGETGSEDAIHFYRIDEGVGTLLASTSPGTVANSPEVRIRITRENGGNWKLEADFAGGFSFEEAFTVFDNTYAGGQIIFGLTCEYTSTRRDKFYFDDLRIAPLLPDTEPPVLLSAVAVSASKIDLYFSEVLEEFTAEDPAIYSIDGGLGTPAAAVLNAADQTLVHLFPADSLVSLTDYSLTVSGVIDLAGNIAPVQTAQFSYVEPVTAAAFDILINEIMADPNPPVGLPPVEYIELYNRSDKVFELEGFSFSNGGPPQDLPAYTLLPGAHLIVCDDADADALAGFGPVVELSSFPGLVNTGDELSLTSPDGQLIHRVNYQLSTYGDSQKEEGGWSLELVNPLALCAGESNFRASVSLLGGTPGQPNSVLNELVDGTGPDLLRVFADDSAPFEVFLFFNEGLDKVPAENGDNYQVSNGIEVFSATLVPTEEGVVRLLFTSPLETSVIYDVTVATEVTDCLGNPIRENKLPFALPETIRPGDLVINELLFDPLPGGADFVELYNRSDKVFNLRGLIVGNLRSGEDTIVRQITVDRLIFPAEYVAFTSSPSAILEHYPLLEAAALLANELPGFSNDAGNVTIFRSDATGAVIIDAFDYDESFHHPLLDDTEGVSLERLDPESETQDANNWHSAASTAGYATPAYRNSQVISNLGSASDFFNLAEKKLSPDGDGYQDFLRINYQLDRPGYSVQARIYDAEGRLVKSLFNNELLATEGFFRWDGDTDRGDKARIGIYMVWIGLFHPEGMVMEFKETCVVASRL